MIDFGIFSNKLFKAGIDYYTRNFSTFIKTNGKIRIVNMLNGSILFDDLDPSMITLAGQPFTNIASLQNILYSKGCVCEAPNAEPTPMKYFDLSFDETFE